MYMYISAGICHTVSAKSIIIVQNILPSLTWHAWLYGHPADSGSCQKIEDVKLAAGSTYECEYEYDTVEGQACEKASCVECKTRSCAFLT